MDEQRAGARPGLPIHVLDGSRCHDVVGTGWLYRIEIDLQQVLAGCVSHALECLRSARPATGPAAEFIISVVIDPPPRDPFAEGKIVAIRWGVIRWRRGYRPVGLRVRKASACIVLCLDRNFGASSDEMGRFTLDLG